jgi:hypothetical protein
VLAGIRSRTPVSGSAYIAILCRIASHGAMHAVLLIVKKSTIRTVSIQPRKRYFPGIAALQYMDRIASYRLLSLCGSRQGWVKVWKYGAMRLFEATGARGGAP